MAIRVFVQEDDEIEISKERFPLKALPSKKAMDLRVLLEGMNLGEVLEKASEGLDPDMPLNEEVIKIAENLDERFRYGIISAGLQIGKDSPDYARLTKAIDEAGFKEIWFVIEQIIDVNGFRWLEKMVKNLTETLTANLPQLGETASRLLKKYSEREDLVESLDQKLEKIKSTGLSSLSPNSHENPTTSSQPIPSTV